MRLRSTLFSEILLQGTQIQPKFTALSARPEAVAAGAEAEDSPEEAAAAGDTASDPHICNELIFQIEKPDFQYRGVRFFYLRVL